MRRLLNIADWHWLDTKPNAPRIVYFLRSGELLVTAILVAFAYALTAPRSVFAQTSAVTWVLAATHGSEATWAVAAVALSITGPLAMALDSGPLRVMSVLSQAIFLLIFGVAFRVNSPTGLVWSILIFCGLWLLARAGMIVRHHWVGGGGNVR